MRILAALLFIFTLPIVVLMATILQAELSPTLLKTELAKQDIYQKALTLLQTTSVDDQQSEQQQQDQVISAISVFMTPEYLQKKTETALDDATNWITDKSQTPPTISFKELKAEIELKNPGLLTNVQELSQSIQNQKNPEAKQNTVKKDALTDFVKNDFTIPLQKNLQGAKDGYNRLKFSFPFLITLLVLNLCVLLMANHTWRKRFRWVGITFVLGGMWGYAVSVIFSVVSQIMIGTILQNKDILIQTIIPVLQKLVIPFAVHYGNNQTVVTIASLTLGTVFFILSFVLTVTSTPPPSPVKMLTTKAKKKIARR